MDHDFLHFCMVNGAGFLRDSSKQASALDLQWPWNMPFSVLFCIFLAGMRMHKYQDSICGEFLPHRELVTHWKAASGHLRQIHRPLEGPPSHLPEENRVLGEDFLTTVLHFVAALYTTVTNVSPLFLYNFLRLETSILKSAVLGTFQAVSTAMAAFADANFFHALETRIASCDSLLCVGLDPHKKELKEDSPFEALKFCKEIIDATHPYAACYKPNCAFFEAFGAAGISALIEVMRLIPRDIPVILDCKRGDIDSTAAACLSQPTM